MQALNVLLTQAQSGDLDAYGTIVQRFQAMAIGYAYSVLGDYHLAEDAAQEAFLEAYPHLEKVYAPAAFPSWLRKIVFKHCDRLTRGKQISTVDLSAADNVAAQTKALPDLLTDQEVSATVHAAIETLPEHERTVTYLFYLANHSQKEIAEFLDVRVSTVKNRLASARKRLHKWFENAVEETLPIQLTVARKDFAMNVLEIIQAAEEGDLTKLGALLERNPKLAKAKAERPGATALHFACWAGQQDAVQLLLDYGADINMEDDSYRSTPLGWALENGQNEMFDFLLVKGAKLKPRQAISTGRLSVVREIVANDPAFINDKRENMLPIHEAALFGQKEMLAYLLENGAEVSRLDDFERTALDITLLHPLPIHGNAYAHIPEGVHLELAEMLIARGAQMKLWHAAALGKLEDVRAIVQTSPTDINGRKFDVMPLYSAALFGHAAVVAFLVANGADVEQGTPNGRRSIHAATWSGSVETAQLLLCAGTDLNAKTKEGITPLHMAVWRRHRALVQWLIENGADLSAVDAYDHTPLDLAQATDSVDGWYPADWGPARTPMPEVVALLQN